MAPAPLPRVRALDGLRGLAVAAVVLFHAGHLTGGYLGVDVFFVLSGFLITSLLLREHAATQRIALGVFWARRARRLLPALALVLVAVAVWSATAAPQEIVGLRADALATIAYVANWHAIASGHDYWALFRSASPLEHTWSLAIEEQFYLVWPLVILGLTRLRGTRLTRAVLTTSLVGAAASYALMQLLYDPANSARVYYGTDTRAASILLGAALAAFLVLRSPSAAPPAALGIAGIVGLAGLLVAASVLAGDDPFLYRIGFFAGAIAATAVIATAVLLPRHPLSRLLGWRPFVALGIISYGVYLWHWPVDVIADADRVGLHGWPLVAVQSLITLGIATISYRLVERPIRRGWGHSTWWRAATPVAAGVVVAAVLLGTAGATPEPTVVSGPVATRAGLELQRLAIDRVVRPSAPRILLAGDSLALALGTGANAHPDDALGVANIGLLGCGLQAGTPIGPPSATPAATCAQWPDFWRKALDVFRPRAIVLLAGAWDLWPREVAGRTLPLYSTALARNLDAALDRAHTIAEDAHVPLVILTVPCLHPNAEMLVRTAPGLADRRRVQWLNRRYREFASRTPGVQLIDLAHRVCALPRTDFLDGVHLTPAGARSVWTWLAPRLIARLPSGPAARAPG